MVCDVCDGCWGHALNAVLPMLCTLFYIPEGVEG